MLRHASIYISHLDEIIPYLEKHIANSPYWNYSMSLKYASTNLQEFMQNVVAEKEPVTPIETERFLKECSKHPKLFELYRITFCITTQISTSRELNRESPNAIAERSTRYCSSEDGLEICKPWWYDNNYILRRRDYNLYCQLAEDGYNRLLAKSLKPEDARGVLPLDTATKVIYTYSVQEWKHIIDLRYYGTTGRPHPNAKLVIGMVREQINQFAKENNIDFQV